MKYEEEFVQFEIALDYIYIAEKELHIPALLDFILELCDFIQHSTLPHPDFKAVQSSVLEVFMQNADILRDIKHLPEDVQSRKFADCYTNMITDLRDAKDQYMIMQSK